MLGGPKLRLGRRCCKRRCPSVLLRITVKTEKDTTIQGSTKKAIEEESPTSLINLLEPFFEIVFCLVHFLLHST